MSLDYEIYKEGGILNDRYQKVDDISEGSYGYVSLAKDLKLKKLVAIKYIFKLDNDENDFDGPHNMSPRDSSVDKKHNLEQQKKSLISDSVKSKFSNSVCFEAIYEVDIQTKIGKHRNIAELLDFFDSYIIMEYCTGGDLYEAIKDDIVPKRTKSITYIISQIMDAVEFVHNRQIYHRDIKPENILITGIDWTIKLTDWGLATTEEKSMDRSVGSERYMCPELFESNLDIQERKEPYRCDKVDLWAMGIVFLNIVFHKNPFSVANQSDKSFCYFAANREALFDVFSTMTYDFFQVLRYCLTIDPTNRDLQKMREELTNLTEYTLDDDYYNSLEDEYDIQFSTITPTKSATSEEAPPSSAPVSLPTPISSSKPLPHIKNDDFKLKDEKIPNNTFKKPYEIPKFRISPQNHSFPYNENGNISNYNTGYFNKKYDNRSNKIGNNSENFHRERAKSAPRLKFNKRPRVRNNHNYKNSNYNNNNNNNNNNNIFHNNKGVKMRNRNKNRSKIIKDSRKPLGIPTPNTHINTFFHDYKSKEENYFNTRDFFTPPSVQNRYMEGIFDSNNRYHKSQHKTNYLTTYNNNGSNNSNNSNNYSNNYSKSWNNKNTKFRRPSTTGNQAFSSTYNTGSRSRHSFNSSIQPSGTAFRRSSVQHSPGSYIPPNARNNYYNNTTNSIFSASPHIPNISSVLDENDTIQSDRYHQDHVANDDDHDSDDILFSLDEGDHEYINGMNNLSLHDGSSHNNEDDHINKMNNANQRINDMNSLHINVPEHNNIHTNSTINNDFPDLLKSPVNGPASLNNNPMKNMDNQFLNISHNLNHAVENKFKPGVYVPPHHRRSSGYSTNEAVLSISPNSISIKKMESKTKQIFQKPIIPIRNSETTVALQDQDVFRYSDNDVLTFEDDDDDINENEDRQGQSRTRRSFGPYQIYNDDDENNSRLNAYRLNRRKSSIQDEAVGSLEQYKNNWLMLQQQQD